LELTESLLLGAAGRWGEPRALPAILARLRGEPVPDDPVTADATPPGLGQVALFDELLTAATDLDDVITAYRDQLARLARVEQAGRFRLLVAAESAGALAGAEMGAAGLPWRADAHDEVLLELLGEASPVGPPRRLVELTTRISAAFGGARVHPESPADV